MTNTLKKKENDSFYFIGILQLSNQSKCEMVIIYICILYMLSLSLFLFSVCLLLLLCMCVCDFFFAIVTIILYSMCCNLTRKKIKNQMEISSQKEDEEKENKLAHTFTQIHALTLYFLENSIPLTQREMVNKLLQVKRKLFSTLFWCRNSFFSVFA